MTQGTVYALRLRLRCCLDYVLQLLATAALEQCVSSSSHGGVL